MTEFLFARPDKIQSPLYVVTTVFNSVRYKSRWRLYQDFELMVKQAGAQLLTVEVAFGNRAFTITDPDNRWHVQLRSQDELWTKEVALNLGIQRLPADWQYVAWIDADVAFRRPDWASETVQQLQHYDIVQMFHKAIDFGPKHEPQQTHTGFVYAYQEGILKIKDKPYEGYHPGYAWAMRKSAFNTLGGLLDVAILGAGDRHMATALLSDVDRSYPIGLNQGYVNRLRQWQDRARDIKRNIGYMDGTLLHAFHGPKKARNYLGRWQVLIKNGYNPDTDLKRDWQGLWQLESRNPRQVQLRDDIRAYLRSRNEDSLEV